MRNEEYERASYDFVQKIFGRWWWRLERDTIGVVVSFFYYLKQNTLQQNFNLILYLYNTEMMIPRLASYRVRMRTAFTPSVWMVGTIILTRPINKIVIAICCTICKNTCCYIWEQKQKERIVVDGKDQLWTSVATRADSFHLAGFSFARLRVEVEDKEVRQ